MSTETFTSLTRGDTPDLSAQIQARHDSAIKALAELRKKRTDLNAAIKEAVAEEATARRLAHALQPRKRRTSKEMKG